MSTREIDRNRQLFRETIDNISVRASLLASEGFRYADAAVMVIEGKHHPQYGAWTQSSLYKEFCRDYRNTNPGIKEAVQLAIRQSFGNYPESDTLVEIGTGEGLAYPLRYLPKGIDLVSIEPNAHAVEAGIAAGRIPPDIRQINRDGPPYGLNQVQGLFGISSFHALSKSELTAALEDISTHMSPKGNLCHIQHLSPSPMFLAGCDEDLYADMDKLFKAKYPKLAANDNSNLLSIYAQELYRTTILGGYYRHPAGSDNYDWERRQVDVYGDLKRDSRRFESFQKQLATAAHNSEELDIEPSVSEIGLSRKLVYLIRNYFCLLDGCDQKFRQSDYIKITESLRGVDLMLMHDMFEFYLMSLLPKFGFRVQAEQLAVFVPAAKGNKFEVEIDGFAKPGISVIYPGDVGVVRVVRGCEVVKNSIE